MTRRPGVVIAVVGAGAMGRITIRDLMETAPAGTRVLVCDVNRRQLRSVVRENQGAGPRRVRLRTAVLDVRNTQSAVRLFRSADVFGVINAAQHDFNLAVMDAALAAGAHYCDLGGLFHVTRRQLARHRAWKDAGRLALLGIGAAPGIVNVLARSAADAMDEIHEIHVAVAGAAPSPKPTDPPLAVSYSIQTIIQEATQKAAVFTGGRMTFVDALSGEIEMRFPEPVGVARPAFTIHSEVATLPRSFRAKGLRECTFRIAFPAVLVDRLKFLRDAGLLSTRPVMVGSARVAPRDALLSALRSQALRPQPSFEEQYEILRTIVRGVRDGRAVEAVVDCHTTAKVDWAIGTDINTGSPPSIAMQMLAAGEITGRGCLAPETAVPVEPFLRQLATRGMTIHRSIRRWHARERDEGARPHD